MLGGLEGKRQGGGMAPAKLRGGEDMVSSGNIVPWEQCVNSMGSHLLDQSVLKNGMIGKDTLHGGGK